jgi:hypothetical protein
LIKQKVCKPNQSSGSKISSYIIDMTLIKWMPNGYVYIDSGRCLFELLTNGGYLHPRRRLMMSKQQFGSFRAWTSPEYWDSQEPALRVFWARPFLSFSCVELE